jgi:Transposase, Mutator family
MSHGAERPLGALASASAVAVERSARRHIVCCDGLRGLPDAIRAPWPAAEVQLCVVHLVRSSLRFTSKKYWGPVCRELREIYTAPSVDAATARFAEFVEHWRDVSPAMVATWERAWDDFVPFLAFPVELRQLVYTTDDIVNPGRVSSVASGRRRACRPDFERRKLDVGLDGPGATRLEVDVPHPTRSPQQIAGVRFAVQQWHIGAPVRDGAPRLCNVMLNSSRSASTSPGSASGRGHRLGFLDSIGELRRRHIELPHAGHAGVLAPAVLERRDVAVRRGFVVLPIRRPAPASVYCYSATNTTAPRMFRAPGAEWSSGPLTLRSVHAGGPGVSHSDILEVNRTVHRRSKNASAQSATARPPSAGRRHRRIEDCRGCPDSCGSFVPLEVSRTCGS